MVRVQSADAQRNAASHSSGVRPVLAALLLSCTALTVPAMAQEAPAAEEAPDDENTIIVSGSLGALPNKDVGTIFGFNKTIVDTPRSASTVSAEQMERFGVSDIYDLVAQSPGVFTQSFFGSAGGLDIRGTPGEVYFRGMRRLDNPGNYPTPIGASDRIDIVRGPASPIFGPSKTGGYMNFVPKSARVAGGKYLDGPEGEISYTTGSWSRSVLSAQLRGPAKLGGQEFGYSLYAEVEDSGSYFRNIYSQQTVLQAAFDADLSSNLRIEFGGMYHRAQVPQNGGWNRLTQTLVDNGTYITGSAQPLDMNGDGVLAPDEFVAAGGLFGFAPFFPGGPATATAADFTGSPYLALSNVGTTTLSRRDVLTGPNDKNNNTAKTAYLDIIYDGGDGLEIKNQLFYDGYDNLNENAYGFAQFANSYVIENKLVVSKKFINEAGKFTFQISPSIRYTDFLHGDDFTYEYFHRVDLTAGYDALSTRLLATQSDKDWSSYIKGYNTDLAFAGLANLDFNFGLDVTVGARYDSIYVKSKNDISRITLRQIVLDAPFPPGSAPDHVYEASGKKGGWSWTASANYRLPFGLVPYATASRQTTLIAGQGAEVDPDSVAGGTFVSASNLYEGGIKGTWLGGRLYAALSIYKQKRTDFNSQSITVNQAVETKGLEAEMRWAVDEHLLITGAYTKTKVYNLTAQGTGQLFSFFGIEDLPGIDPALYLGGQPGGNLPITTAEQSLRAGIPQNIFAGTATYAFDNGLAFAVSATHVESVFSGQSQAVKLPAYTLVDASASFTTGPLLLRMVVKNVTNATYYRANFTELFGSTIVLPERPRSFQASIVYKF
ncbi:MAG: TonB-dependent receptor plug domain-containing protein [Alphaproteobacteria bacterium]|nr:TonB-dependent receptor plug domain-containing protein [Alphaproteobacteria bacterium]